MLAPTPEACVGLLRAKHRAYRVLSPSLSRKKKKKRADDDTQRQGYDARILRTNAETGRATRARGLSSW